MSNTINYVYGDQSVQVPAHLNFGKYILDKLRTKNDDIALEHGDTREKLTYKELTQNAINLSDALTKLGVARGDTVAIGSEKRNEYVPTVLGILFTGATCTPYDLKSGKTILKHKISVSQPKYFLGSKLFLNTFKDLLKSLDCIKTIITLDEPEEWIVSIRTLVTSDVDINKFEPQPVQGQTDTAFILYSSGTTGMPKGVELSHLTCILNSLPDCFRSDSLKTAYMFGNWYHNYSIFMTFKFLQLGRKIVYTNEINPQTFLQCVEDCEVNIAFISPSFVWYLSDEKEPEKYNLDSLKIIYSRSTPLHSKAIKKVQDRFPKLENVLQGYGMTESGEPSSEFWGDKGPKPGSAGKASPGVTLKVVHLESNRILGPNQRGEIRLRGPGVMKGYIGINRSDYIDEEGFFKTGDLGYYDNDEYIYVIERIKEFIINDGYKLSPTDLEAVLQMHPAVKEAAVVGKPVLHRGEKPTAFVVKQDGADITEEELFNYVAEEVPPYMYLTGGVRFIEEIPKNASGKNVRQRLREMLQ